MSAHAAIAPAAGVQVRRPPVGRMVIVAVAYLAIVIVRATYPLISPLNGIWAGEVTPLDRAVDALWAVLWLAVLLVSMARQPEGRLWKLIFLMVVAGYVGALQWVPNSVVWSLGRVLEIVWVPLWIQLVVTFPTGYFRDRFDRFVVGLAYALAAAFALKELLLVGDWWQLLCDPECVRNTFVVWPDAVLHDRVTNVIVAGFCLVLIPLVIVALWRHWRAAAAPARRTLLPLIVGVPPGLIITMVEVLSGEFEIGPGTAFFDSPSGRAIGLLAPFIFPVGLLVALVRARWSRARVANLVVELGRGVPVGGLRDVLARTLDDPSLELAFAAPSGSGYVDATGQPVELPVRDPDRTVTRLEREDELLGVLVHDPAIEAEDPGLVEAVGNAARLALENERLAAEVRAQLEEVRASRARIVETADAERRRVERDLHDGAQQRLVALALRLQVASRTTPEASALLEAATGELQTAIGEVRGLARGVHPTILTEAGLRAAVDALAERTPLPVTVDIPEKRFDPQLEATAYFFVAEALTNVARYAAAGEARVTAVEDDGRLVVAVADDGRGGADPTAGSGLRGLSDRLAAIDGRLTITSPPAGGTTVRAELPLATRASSTTTSPAPAAASALARVRAVPETHAVPRRPARVRLSSPAVLLSVVAALFAALAVVAALPGLQPSAPDSGRDESFVRPFDYQVPSGSNIRLYPHSDRLHVLSAAPGDVQGISIWAVDDVLVDHCSWEPTTPLVAREPGVDGLLAYIRSVDHLHVEEIGALTIDSRPAYRVDLTLEGNDSGCTGLDNNYNGLVLWRDKSADGHGGLIQVYGSDRVPVTLLDVDGQTIAIEIWSGGEMDDWRPTAETIVDSIRFLYRPPAETSPASPARSP
ncbi:MAG TPA: sensor histidine kinase [Candidatus Limnocylindrales bacterium]|nr:sensor histidine kinase [Candidatus Limnocylindrales bacterium]